jgi:hypothetical protein
MPPGLELDPVTGWYYGYIPDQGVTEVDYSFNIVAYQDEFVGSITCSATAFGTPNSTTGVAILQDLPIFSIATDDGICAGFVVRSGSEAMKDEVPSCHLYLKELRSTLIGNGVLQQASSGYVFTQDYVFNSPSTAAGVVQGRNANGRVEWKTKDGRTLRELQEAETNS